MTPKDERLCKECRPNVATEYEQQQFEREAAWRRQSFQDEEAYKEAERTGRVHYEVVATYPDKYGHAHRYVGTLDEEGRLLRESEKADQ